MNITVEIDCETIQDFHTHLHELQKQIRKHTKKMKLDPVKDMFPVPDNHNGEIEVLYDENCYGEHAVFIREIEVE